MSLKKLNKEEDSKLANWKKWLTIRKDFHKYVSNRLQRKTIDLVINSGENYRSTIEDKLILQYARIPQSDRARGSPAFWILPPASLRYPALISVPKKEQNYELPPITYIGVPKVIKEEKDISFDYEEDDEKSQTIRNKQSSYHRRQVKKLKKDLKRVQPHKPEMDDLVVIGKSTTNVSKSTSYNTENEELLSVEDLTQPSCSKTNTNFILVGLQVEKKKIYLHDKSQKIYNCYICINYDLRDLCTEERSITFKNLGIVAIRFYWKRVIPERILKDVLPFRPLKYSFIFEKNERIIAPEKSHELKISFSSKERGVHKETWELCTEPNIFTTGGIRLNLWACVELPNSDEIESAILNRIEEGLKYTAVEDTLFEITKRVRVCTEQKRHETVSILEITEKDKFEAVNAEFGPSDTLPLIYYYNEALVKELKHIYNEVKTDLDSNEWNYSIKDLRSIIERCDNVEIRERCIFNFETTVGDIFKTNMMRNVEQYKYNKVHTFLCIMIDQITERVYDLRKKFKIPFIEIYPAIVKETLNKQEKLDDNLRSRKFFPDLTERRPVPKIKKCKSEPLDRPAMEILKSIPFEDVDLRYKMYQKEKYGIIIDDDAKGKRKKGKAKKKKERSKSKDKKKSKKDKSKDRGKSKERNKSKKTKYLAKKEEIITPSTYKQLSLSELLQDKLIIRPDYLDEDDFEPPTSDSIRMYNYNLYVTVYSLLTETISEMVTLLEYLESQKTISRSTLKHCIQLGIPVLNNETRRMSSELLKQVESVTNISDTSITTLTTCDSSESLLSLSRVYSRCKSMNFVYKYDSTEDIGPKECIDVATETEGGKLYPSRTRIGFIQTDARNEIYEACSEIRIVYSLAEGSDDNFDLVADFEREIWSTSTQLFKPPQIDQSTQTDKIEIHTESVQFQDPYNEDI